MDETSLQSEAESTSKSNGSWLVVLALIVVAVGTYWYYRSSGGPQTAMTDSSPTAMVNEVGVANTSLPVAGQSTEQSMEIIDGVKVFTLEAGNFSFKPNVISVKKGDKVKVVVKSVDMMHDFVVDELDVRSPIVKSGETGEAVFEASKVGSFEFYCSVGSHRANGMVGTITITE